MTRYLSTEQLLVIAGELGVGQVRDIGLLDSAATRPATRVYGVEVYGSIHVKAAVLLESISRNHALIDGNKRLAWTAVVVFYGLNGLRVVAPFDHAYDLVIGVCTGEIAYEESAARLAHWAQPPG